MADRFTKEDWYNIGVGLEMAVERFTQWANADGASDGMRQSMNEQADATAARLRRVLPRMSGVDQGRFIHWID